MSTASSQIASLFTNVPLAETIQICADAFYNKNEPPFLPYPKIFIELMEMATRIVEFSFNDVIYQQTDGSAI